MKKDKANSMILSKDVFVERADSQSEKWKMHLITLPEKVLQFGTGVLLRGLPGYFIHKANAAQVFNGRIVAVRSTDSDHQVFDRQDNLFTHCIRGLQNGEIVQEQYINTSISRVLSAKLDWEEILKCAGNPELKLIISNTTEAGIVLTRDNVHASPPASFPGKLLAFLYQRYKIFGGDSAAGMVIVPTELIANNAEKLLSILLELAHQNGVESHFMDWLEKANEWCSSLVDCIVPGMQSATEKRVIEQTAGYSDDLMIMSEPYRLWAIESTGEKAAKVLSFASVNEGIAIESDITRFRELKLRLLNGTHTFCCGLAHLAGFQSVLDAMYNPVFKQFITALMRSEIIPSISGDSLPQEDAESFAEKVLTRFSNPFMQHKWISISRQYSSKLCTRNVPMIRAYMDKYGEVPRRMALAFAAHLLFMKSSMDADGKFYGTVNGNSYYIADENAGYYFGKWRHTASGRLAEEILANEKLWGINLAIYKDFVTAVDGYLAALISQNVLTVMNALDGG